ELSVAGEGEHGEQDEIGHGDRNELVPADIGLLAFVHPQRALIAAARPTHVAPEDRAGLLPSGLPAEIAPDFSFEARARDREWRRQSEIGILVGAGAAVMNQVVGTVRRDLGPDR